ncbi:4Fe-4S cluster-binding domain-containing protein [Gracilibacillus massiliensis]|uniref:4Fe-4S cluster-binding domain-containing protein n=1 Tax=Gracilibacillus massiliensis TaxID=1564956 RepID=UPI000B2EB662|nr:4Fe-4S cluster-binding domain-containing protein [Gracilibacillus massiliensis]
MSGKQITMKLYNNFIRTFSDLPNHTTLLVHSLSGCPLHCYGCLNYDEIIANTPKDYKTTEDLYDYLIKSGYLFDAVMFSGGEFLINPFNEIRELLQNAKEIFAGKIIVTTSGIYFRKVRALYDENLVDGIHIDMKLPYHILDVKEDAKIYQDIMGITPNKKLVEELIASVDAVIEHNTLFDQVRTVKYPLLDEAFFQEIEHFIEKRKVYHQSIVPYFLNEFVIPNN